MRGAVLPFSFVLLVLLVAKLVVPSPKITATKSTKSTKTPENDSGLFLVERATDRTLMKRG
jgi:hypothetical protein